jgi:hypothetical protein
MVGDKVDLTPDSETDRLWLTPVTVTVSLADYSTATSATYSFDVKIFCSDLTLVVPDNYGPFSHTALDVNKVTTPSYAFTKNCDEGFPYTYTV